jgi:hypothetical protein
VDALVPWLEVDVVPVEDSDPDGGRAAVAAVAGTAVAVLETGEAPGEGVPTVAWLLMLLVAPGLPS